MKNEFRIVWFALVVPALTAFVVPSVFTADGRSQRSLSLRLFNKDTPSDVRHKLEFKNLGNLPETDTRRERIAKDMEIQDQFEPFGDNLWELRSEMEQLSHKLIDAIEVGCSSTESKMREKLRRVEGRDPELAYKIAVANLEQAKQEGRTEGLEEYQETANAARSCLPQFNLDGLWVGKYGSSYDLINITYVGDTLIAEKVTGDGNVPRGAISFQADLHPLRRNKLNEDLDPIDLTDKAAQKWGTRKLPRYPGLGQVAEENFINHQWIDGQLIIIGKDYFSFAWLPVEQQIFFGRPSPDLALKMLRDAGVTRVPQAFDAPPSLGDDLSVQKDFVSRCLEMTHDQEDEVEGRADGGIWCFEDDSQECYFG